MSTFPDLKQAIGVLLLDYAIVGYTLFWKGGDMSAKKAKHTLLYQPSSSLEGHSFRAVSDGVTVKIQTRSPDESKYVTVRTINKEDWDAFASSTDLYNPYHNNPSHIAKLAQSGRSGHRT